MSARTLLYRTGTLALFREVFYTLAQIGEEPLAAPFVPVFEKHRDGLKQILLQEIGHIEQIAKAQATVDRVDARLDRFVLRVIRIVDEKTDGNTNKQIRKKLLRGKSISKFRRPVLGRQLADMADWSDTLAKCGVPDLAALAAEAGALFKLGTDAAALRDKAQSDNRTFRDVGERKQFIDALNASRKEVDGALAKLPFQDPTLPQDFADAFFLREPAREEEDETIADVKSNIAALEAQLAEEKAHLAQMEQEAAEAARAEQEAKDKEEQAAALEAQAAALLQQAAALKGNR